MKKITVAILAVIYLVVSSGVAMSIHYCMGKVASVDLMHSSAVCGKCGMKTTGDCCRDEFKMVKLSDSHNLITNNIKIEVPVVAVNGYRNIFDTDILFPRYRSNLKNHSPPTYPGISLNIMNCVFRI